MRCAPSAPKHRKSALSMRSKRTLVVCRTTVNPSARPLSMNWASQAL